MSLSRWLHGHTPLQLAPWEGLHSPDRWIRQQAKQMLVDAHDHATLLQATTSPYAPARAEAIAGLAQLGGHEPELRRALHDPDPAVRQEAIRRGAVPTAIHNQADLHALGTNGTLQQVPAIEAFLDTGDHVEAAWVAIAYALQRLPAYRADLLQRRTPPTRHEAFIWCCPHQASFLLANPTRRERVAAILGEIGSSADLPALQRAMEAGSPSATHSYERLGGARRALEEALKNPHTVVPATLSLQRRADPAALPALRAALGQHAPMNLPDPPPDAFIKRAIQTLETKKASKDQQS